MDSTTVSSTPNQAPQLEELVSAISAIPNLSITSNTKWREVDAALARRLGLDVAKVKTCYIGKKKQMSVRLTQPGVANAQPRFGLALVADDVSPEKYLQSARKYVAPPHHFDVLVMAGWDSATSELTAHGAVARGPNSLVDATKSLFGLSEVQVVSPPPPSPLFVAPDSVGPSEASFGIEEFVEETGIPAEKARRWVATLKRRGQAIFQGPPGTGKSFIAARLAKLIARESGGISEVVVFHSSYTYSDFIAGLAPVLDGDGKLSYERLPGKLLQFCEQARALPADGLAVLVIDEINRADLSSVFGELMYALEYREEAIGLAHGPGDGTFRMPSNVLLLGTMNSADRSIASFDHALRRRFSFFTLQPDYELLAEKLSAAGLDPKPLVSVLNEINEQIKDPNFALGVSFFISAGSELPELFEDIWESEVLPYLAEIFRGRDEILRRFGSRAVTERCLPVWSAAEASGRSS